MKLEKAILKYKKSIKPLPPADEIMVDGTHYVRIKFYRDLQDENQELNNKIEQLSSKCLQYAVELSILKKWST